MQALRYRETFFSEMMQAMAERIITVTVPETMYTQLEVEVRAHARSMDEFITQTLTRTLPLALEPDLPSSVEAELQAMEHLSDEALWAIARSQANDDKVALYDLLIERQDAGALTSEGKKVLTQLREETDALMVRKAHAFVLLRDRGYPLPTLDELPTEPA